MYTENISRFTYVYIYIYIYYSGKGDQDLPASFARILPQGRNLEWFMMMIYSQ